MATPRRRYPHQPHLYRAVDVARILGLSAPSVAKLRRQEAFKVHWLSPTVWVVERRELLRYVRSCPTRRPQSGRDDMSRARAALARKLVAMNPALLQETKEGKDRAANGIR